MEDSQGEEQEQVRNAIHIFDIWIITRVGEEDGSWSRKTPEAEEEVSFRN